MALFPKPQLQVLLYVIFSPLLLPHTDSFPPLFCYNTHECELHFFNKNKQRSHNSDDIHHFSADDRQNFPTSGNPGRASNKGT